MELGSFVSFLMHSEFESQQANYLSLLSIVVKSIGFEIRLTWIPLNKFLSYVSQFSSSLTCG